MKKTLPKTPSPRIPAAARKASIIQSAASVFSEKGFNGTKTREIAALAGVSEALIFKHFPSKEDLYTAILAEKSPVPGLLEQIREFAEQRKDIEVFQAIAETIVGGAPDQNLMRLILFSALENHELSDMFFHNHIRHFYDVLSAYIEQRIQEGVFRPVPPLVAARSFMGMLIYHRLLTVLFQAPVEEDSEEITRTFVEVFLNGLRKPSDVHPGRTGSTRSSKSRKRKDRS